MADVRGASPDAELAEMRERWAPAWMIWRSRNSAGELNEWCATRRGEGRGFSMTLMLRTATELEAALREHGERVGQGLLHIGYQG